jgi:CBS domain-containing protein
MIVKQAMTTNLIYMSPYTMVSEAAQLMLKKRVRRLLVVENKMLIGIVSHNDLPPQIKPQLRVQDIMTINPITVNENTDIIDAVSVMRQLNIGSLPVINDYGQAVGIITNYDIQQLMK